MSAKVRLFLSILAALNILLKLDVEVSLITDPKALVDAKPNAFTLTFLSL